MSGKVKFFWEEPIEVKQILEPAIRAYDNKPDLGVMQKLWSWRFANCPLNDRVYAAYIMENSQVASFYAVSPIGIRAKGQTLKAGLAVWGFTNPDFMGKGYYSQLYNEAQERLKAEGFGCLLAFDNHNSHYPEVKYLGWRDIGVLSQFSLNLSSDFKERADGRSHKIEHLPLSDANLQAVCDCFAASERVQVERSLPFLSWRLRDNPLHNYKLMGISSGQGALYVIYKEYSGNEIDIMEMVHTDLGLEAASRLRPALAYWRDLGCRKVNLWSNLFSEEHLQLEKLGFQEAGFSAYFVHRNLSGDFDLSSFRDWHVRFLDSDVY